MSKFADEKVEELKKFICNDFHCSDSMKKQYPECEEKDKPINNCIIVRNMSTFFEEVRKAIADAEKRGEIKAYADMIEELGASIFNEVEGREYCENKIKQLEGG